MDKIIHIPGVGAMEIKGEKAFLSRFASFMVIVLKVSSCETSQSSREYNIVGQLTIFVNPCCCSTYCFLLQNLLPIQSNSQGQIGKDLIQINSDYQLQCFLLCWVFLVEGRGLSGHLIWRKTRIHGFYVSRLGWILLESSVQPATRYAVWCIATCSHAYSGLLDQE